MRWVKTVVITAIVLAIIPTIVLSINKITDGYIKRVEYEIIITRENIGEKVYELYNLVKLDTEGRESLFPVTNWLYIEYDGRILNDAFFYYYEPYNYLKIHYDYSEDGKEYRIIELDLDDPINRSTFTGQVLKIVLYDDIIVKPPVSPTGLILISLIPLILVSGLLIYQYKELKLRKEWKACVG